MECGRSRLRHGMCGPVACDRFAQSCLGLEAPKLLVAGDIIRTVAIAPTFTSVGVLAVIVAVRTFLSFTLEVELTSRWPWDHDVRADGKG